MSCNLNRIGLALLITFSIYSGELSAQSSRTTARSSGIKQIKSIDRMIKSVWDAYDIEPSPAAKDNEWCRRVFLDVIGRIPTVKELADFTDDRASNKYGKLINRLLYDEQYTEEFSRNWTTIWTNLLIGRTGGTGNRTSINRAGMQKYLRDSFARNKPYDRMVYELVTATGSVDPDSEDFNGAANFLIEKVNEDNAAQATAATTRIFLGLQVQCTQCHNHPFNNWKQQKYWEMNAFFRQAQARNVGRRAQRMGQMAVLRDIDFMGESNNYQEADIFYEMRNGIVQVAYPVFMDGTEIDKNGLLGKVNRRKELANLMLNSPYLDQVIVNRMWGHFLGYGFTKPVDDLGPHNPPSNPELLNYLANEFRNVGYDMRHLIKWITLSKPYSLSSQIKKAAKDDPLSGETPKYARFYLRQMRAEELYESLLVASRAEQNLGSYEDQERRKNIWLQQFSQAFGTDEGDESTTFNGTIPQVLMMFNGDMIRQATSGRSGSFIAELANYSKYSGKEKIDQLFLAGLARRATAEELNIAQKFYSARNGNTLEALQDVWWVILNSNEFIFNH